MCMCVCTLACYCVLVCPLLLWQTSDASDYQNNIINNIFQLLFASFFNVCACGAVVFSSCCGRWCFWSAGSAQGVGADFLPLLFAPVVTRLFEQQSGMGGRHFVIWFKLLAVRQFFLKQTDSILRFFGRTTRRCSPHCITSFFRMKKWQIFYWLFSSKNHFSPILLIDMEVNRKG